VAWGVLGGWMAGSSVRRWVDKRVLMTVAMTVARRVAKSAVWMAG